MANSESKSRQLNEERSTETTIKYRECRRNHAVLIGGYAADGCGEFTPKGDQGTKEALLCDACDCHRNFHRKELIKNGMPLPGSHCFLSKYAPLQYPMWKERNASAFHPVYPQPDFSPYYHHHYCPEKEHSLVSDEESVIYDGSQNEKQMQAGKRPKREYL